VSELTDCRTRPSGSPERQARAPRGTGGTTQPETEEISRARSTVGAVRTASRRHRPGPVDVRSAQEGERRLASHPNRCRRGARAENSGDVHRWLPSRGGWRRPVRRADLVGNITEPHRRDPQSTRGPRNGQQGSSVCIRRRPMIPRPSDPVSVFVASLHGSLAGGSTPRRNWDGTGGWSSARSPGSSVVVAWVCGTSDALASSRDCCT
jgi:hypothetical protein